MPAWWRSPRATPGRPVLHRVPAAQASITLTLDEAAALRDVQSAAIETATGSLRTALNRRTSQGSIASPPRRRGPPRPSLTRWGWGRLLLDANARPTAIPRGTERTTPRAYRETDPGPVNVREFGSDHHAHPSGGLGGGRHGQHSATSARGGPRKPGKKPPPAHVGRGRSVSRLLSGRARRCWGRTPPGASLSESQRSPPASLQLSPQ